jgi:hypothetical protein
MTPSAERRVMAHMREIRRITRRKRSKTDPQFTRAAHAISRHVEAIIAISEGANGVPAVIPGQMEFDA